MRLVWLCDRQMRRLALGVLASSLGLGVLFMVVGPLLWPVATLLLGVLCGVTVFSDEQANGSYRFLGEQRFPLGRVWIIKTCSRFALLLLASFVLLVPSLLVALYHSSDHSNNQDRPFIVAIETMHLNLIVLVVPLMPYLLMWLLYGFSAGQLCGLLSRKSIVAGMIALMTSAMLAVVWLPSLAGIGLHLWQVAAPALILWATTAFLVRAWAADRLASLRTYVGVSVAAVAALLCMVYGLWYRVAEIPDVPEPFDVAGYKASLPTPEENEAGQLIRSVWGRVESVMRDLNSSRDKKQPLNTQLLNTVLDDGWPAGNSEWSEWMDKTFAENWLQPLAPLPDLPTGMVVDPRFLTERELPKEQMKWGQAPGFGMVLAARGLQQQAGGDPAVFVEHLRIALALSRNLQHHAPSQIVFFEGRAMERIWPAAVDLWLKNLRGRPDLLRLALQTLIDHESRLPDEREPEKVDYLIARNTLMNTPDQLLDNAVLHRPQKDEGYRQAEVQTAAVLWLIPWEQARHQRLLRVQFGGTPQELQKSLEWGGEAFTRLNGFFGRRLRGLFPLDRSRRELANLRACQLKVAVRLYQAENGDLPPTLDALVPRYLKSLPRDPFANGEPFRYRRSSGEWIAWSETNQAAQPGGMPQPPGEAAVMPHADEQAAPPAPPLAPGAGMAAGVPRAFVDENPPPEGVPIMPRAEEPVGPPPGQRVFRGIVLRPGERPPTLRFVAKGQGVLWSVGEDTQDDGGKKQGIQIQRTSVGEDLIYLVPPPG
jgi:hypothetical protein